MPRFAVARLTARRCATIAVGATLASAGVAAVPAAAGATPNQIAIIQDNSDLFDAPGALAQFRELGANTIRVVAPWSLIAPGPRALTKPKFNATDPNAYPKRNWVPYDNIVRQARSDHLTVDLVVTGGAPRWAEGPGSPNSKNLFYAWRPNAADYGQFFQAVAARYSGHFTPRGQDSPLPAVHFWAIFNEPNFGEDLGPQGSNDSTIASGPAMFRGLLNQGWSALHRTGHGHDTILWGEFASDGFEPGRFPRPTGLPGNYGQTRPLLFLRDLYCVNSRFQQLRGSAARVIGCPTNASGSARFASHNPALFDASGVSDHPYPQGESPVSNAGNKVDYARFQDLGNFARELDRLNRVYGSRKRFPIYNTEYGYITRPPKGAPYPSPTTAAYFDNWAEYLSYKNPRIKSYMQYLLTDPPPNTGKYAGFASGLETYRGAKKATFYAFRMPFFMPRTSFSRRQSVEVWGDVRPAPFAVIDGYKNQRAQIQLKSGPGPFKTIATVSLNRPGGYFDIRMKFPSSGLVRVRWTYPNGDPLLSSPNVEGQTISSRTIAIKAR
jgi:hypothetical protein